MSCVTESEGRSSIESHDNADHVGGTTHKFYCSMNCCKSDGVKSFRPIKEKRMECGGLSLMDFS